MKQRDIMRERNRERHRKKIWRNPHHLISDNVDFNVIEESMSVCLKKKR